MEYEIKTSGHTNPRRGNKENNKHKLQGGDAMSSLLWNKNVR